MNISFNAKQIAKTGGLLLAGIILGWFFFGGSASPGNQSVDIDQHIEETHTDEEGQIVYTCSMHPQVRQHEPGNCPICGMELIPAGNSGSEGESDDDPYTTTMTQAAMKLAQVQTAEITRGKAIKKSRMPGKVMIDERELSIIPAHFPGRIEKLYLDYTGAYVKKGDPIASVYSPELVTAQKELLEAYKNRESNPALYQATRKKFANWEISQRVIDQIIENGRPRDQFDIYSHHSGYVTQRHVAVGDHIHFGKPIFEIADLSNVWIEFEAYENDLAGISRGDEVQFSVGAYPGETFKARVTYIDPILDDQKRTATVRAEAANPDQKLKPNMLARGIVSSELDGGKPQLQVPASAVLWTGERSLVYIQLANVDQPSFQAREVLLGQRVGDSYIIKEGLQEGEKVVVNGNFMIDSAAQLADKRSMMNQAPGQNQGRIPGGHNHGGDNMDTDQQHDLETSHSSLSKENIPTVFRQQLNNLIDSYLLVSNALAEDNFEQAMISLDSFSQKLEETDMNLIKNRDQMKLWMQHQQQIDRHVLAMKKSGEIESFRSKFADLSNQLVETVDQFGIDKTLHLQFCPMAKEMEGAYWLSTNSEIINPYMGQQMLSCGSTEDILKMVAN